jgi:6-phosphogluconolactonase
MSRRVVFRTHEQLASHAAAFIARRACGAIRARGRCLLVLAGGETPRSIYQQLALREHARTIDWPHVDLLWSDERCVPPDDPRSNHRMARETLLDAVPVLDDRVHRIRGEQDAEAAANDYEARVTALLGADGRFDLTVLGVGSDGHTASLFPGDPALDETQRLARAVRRPKPEPWRVTLTLPALSRSREVLFIVTGRAKRTILRRLEAGEKLPAARVRPDGGCVTWWVDRDAAP